MSTPIPAPPPPASSTRPGLVSIVAQAFSGLKNFLDGIAVAAGTFIRLNGSTGDASFTYDSDNSRVVLSKTLAPPAVVFVGAPSGVERITLPQGNYINFGSSGQVLYSDGGQLVTNGNLSLGPASTLTARIIKAETSQTLYLQGQAPDAPGSVAVAISTTTVYTTSGYIFAFQNAGTNQLLISFKGKLSRQMQNASKVSGNITASGPVGYAVIPSGSSSLVVTNDHVTSESIIAVHFNQAAFDATLNVVMGHVIGAGSFSIIGNASATSNVEVWWEVQN